MINDSAKTLKKRKNSKKVIHRLAVSFYRLSDLKLNFIFF